MLLQLPKSLGRATAAVERASDDHVVLALFDVSEPVLQLENLLTVPALNPDLINDVVEVPVLLLRVELVLALAALGPSLVEPLLNAVAVEDLLAAAALHRAERDAQADGTDERIDEPAVLLLNILFSKSVRLLKHKLDEIPIDSLYDLLRLLRRILLQHGQSVLLTRCLLLLVYRRVHRLLLRLTFNHSNSRFVV